MKIMFTGILFLTTISMQSFASMDEACFQKIEKAVGAVYSTNVQTSERYEVQQKLGVSYFLDEKRKEIISLKYEVSGMFQGFKSDELFRKYKVQVYEKNCEIKLLKNLQ